MSSDCIIRNYHPDDFDILVQLKNEVASLAADGRYLSPQATHDSLRRPNYTPEHDLFIAEISGRIVGYLDITSEARIGRAILECLVLPEHRQQGVCRKLYSQAVPRMKALGAKVAHVNIHEDNNLARSVLEQMGFSFVRRFHELEVNLDIISDSRLSISSTIRPLQAGEEALLTEIQNRSFNGYWGYNPNTVEEIRYAISTASHTLEGICLALDKDRPFGYFWVRIEHDKQGKRRGRVSMLGTDPDHRGKGIGRELLLAGLSYLKSRRLRVAQLTVDSENLVAESLYRSVGFKKVDSSLWYEKALD